MTASYGPPCLRRWTLIFAALLALGSLPAAAQTFTATPGAFGFGFAADSCSDLDMDGIGDLIIGSVQTLGGAGQIDILSGATPPQTQLYPGLLGILGGTDSLGFAIACGDITGDGFVDVIVGAPFATGVPGLPAGSSGYILALDGAVLSFLAGSPPPQPSPIIALLPSRLTPGLASYGFSLDAVDLNMDGIAEVLVGAPSSDTVEVLDPSLPAVINPLTGLPEMVPAMTITSPIPGSNFGWSVAAAVEPANVAADLNGNGMSDFLVGAPGALGTIGAALAYDFVPGAPPAIAPSLVAVGAVPGDQFGFSIDIAPDINASGTADVIAGAPGTGAATGTVSVLEGSTLVALAPVLAGPAGGSSYGFSVASIGDFTGDGIGDLVIGLPGIADPLVPGNTGAAQMVSGATVLPVAWPVAGAPVLLFGSSLGLAGTVMGFGFSVEGPGDITGNGTPNILLGGPGSILAAPAVPGFVFRF